MKRYTLLIMFSILLVGCNTDKHITENFSIKTPTYIIIKNEQQIQQQQKLHEELSRLSRAGAEENTDQITELMGQLQEIENDGLLITDTQIIMEFVDEISNKSFSSYKKNTSSVSFIISFFYDEVEKDASPANEKAYLERIQHGYIDSLVVLSDRSVLIPYISSTGTSLADLRTLKISLSKSLYVKLKSITKETVK
ncbi:hypothetical protein SAMN02745975_03103 [Geosporobacter subterraneus DSM 17957]|uniref:Uncharacterized protein n=1 Tax=Geosporobacter subterraneus DSM 17957 TaxID=1121919 RepID=A0A1M6MVJ9_9FIRM|nr:hypothetical protein [Geosporobacter subterraneus]SHJ87462.1 hypothetical protein SAMN02745975_03103 [Geosporobacter subterraneus DSM 17957]